MKLYAAHLDFTAIIDEFRLDPAFPPDVLADAATATDQHAAGRVDATHIPLVTIDPPGSMDLDQAGLLERPPVQAGRLPLACRRPQAPDRPPRSDKSGHGASS